MDGVVVFVLNILQFIVYILATGLVFSVIAYIFSVFNKYYAVSRWSLRIGLFCFIALILIRVLPLVLFIFIEQGFNLAIILMFGVTTLVTAVGLIIVHTGIFRIAFGRLINHPRFSKKGFGMLSTGIGVMLLGILLPSVLWLLT